MLIEEKASFLSWYLKSIEKLRSINKSFNQRDFLFSKAKVESYTSRMIQRKSSEVVLKYEWVRDAADSRRWRWDCSRTNVLARNDSLIRSQNASHWNAGNHWRHTLQQRQLLLWLRSSRTRRVQVVKTVRRYWVMIWSSLELWLFHLYLYSHKRGRPRVSPVGMNRCCSCRLNSFHHRSRPLHQRHQVHCRCSNDDGVHADWISSLSNVYSEIPREAWEKCRARTIALTWNQILTLKIDEIERKQK